MKLKALVSAVGLATAFALVGPANAQMMMGDLEVSAEDLPVVEAYCADLATAASTETDAGASDDGDDANDGGAEITDQGPQPSATDQGATTIDLSTITVEQCTEAGLTTAAE